MFDVWEQVEELKLKDCYFTKERTMNHLVNIFVVFKVMFLSRRWYRKMKRNRIERMYSRKNTITNQEGLVCMIDICNYSQWCERNTPYDIFETMEMYNNMINHILKKYKKLEKIELVGDCVMIVEWCKELGSMSEFATDMLENIPQIQKLFDDPSVSIRIGIHIGNACSGFLSNPRKFQVFGKTVNVASRIQSAADNGTCLVSVSAIARMNTPKLNVMYKGCYDLKGITNPIHCFEIK